MPHPRCPVKTEPKKRQVEKDATGSGLGQGLGDPYNAKKDRHCVRDLTWSTSETRSAETCRCIGEMNGCISWEGGPMSGPCHHVQWNMSCTPFFSPSVSVNLQGTRCTTYDAFGNESARLLFTASARLRLLTRLPPRGLGSDRKCFALGLGFIESHVTCSGQHLGRVSASMDDTYGRLCPPPHAQ